MPSVALAKAWMLFWMSVSLAPLSLPSSRSSSVSGTRYRCPDCAVTASPMAVLMLLKSRSREQLSSSSHVPLLSCILRDTRFERGREPANSVMVTPQGSSRAFSFSFRYSWPDCVCMKARTAPAANRRQSTAQRTKTRHLRSILRYLRDVLASSWPASFFASSMAALSVFSFACFIRMPALC